MTYHVGVRNVPLIAIGASAGGPSALVTILQDIPRHFAGAIVIVQHVSSQFADDMAQWLNGQSQVPVRVARQGDRPLPSTVLMAGTDDHLIFMDATTLGYMAEPRDGFYRPSIDVFFRSVRAHWCGPVIGVLLTGMGSDGADGLLTLRNAGAVTIAQDRLSSGVYGMPKAAAELNAVSEVLPLPSIGARIAALVRSTTLLPIQRKNS